VVALIKIQLTGLAWFWVVEEEEEEEKKKKSLRDENSAMLGGVSHAIRCCLHTTS
jgi:hypothetical protein